MFVFSLTMMLLTTLGRPYSSIRSLIVYTYIVMPPNFLSPIYVDKLYILCHLIFV